jgi:glycosyltransferase involved in cell wall biosynthesis
MRVALLTAGRDPHYALGLAPALADAGVDLDMIGNSEMAGFPGLGNPRIRFLDFRGDQAKNASPLRKVRRVLAYYYRLFKYAWGAEPGIFHILWPNRFVYFDRTILNLYYRALGKKLVFTAHNVNTEARDQRDSLINRLSLRVQYRLVDRIFVHTEEMQKELIGAYGVAPEKITIVRFPINNVTPQTSLTGGQARELLGIPSSQKVILFFGNVAAYKGIDDLIRALPALRERLSALRLIIAGNVKAGEQEYFDELGRLIRTLHVEDLIDRRIGYIPEEQVEAYFKAADVLVLPYRRIFQSGVLFLSYSFGLPVVVSDAGSLSSDVLAGRTGFVFKQGVPEDLAQQVYRYFTSDLFAELDTRRKWIKDFANHEYSWEPLAATTQGIYSSLTNLAARNSV